MIGTLQRTCLTLGSLFLANAGFAKEITIYESNWTKPGQAIGKEWTTKEGQVQISPNGARTFLAGLRETGVQFKMDGLPAHKVLHLEFDLIVKGSWDGAASKGHHDRALLELADGRQLLAASFRTYAHGRDKQSFPYRYDSGRTTVCHFGSAEQHTLGYLWTYSSDENWPVDTIYRMNWFVPHEGDSLEWKIYTQLGDDDYTQAMWVGLDNVKIGVSSGEEVFADAKWKDLTVALTGDDTLLA